MATTSVWHHWTWGLGNHASLRHLHYLIKITPSGYLELQILLVAGAGLEPAISAYETERITIFHILQYVVRTRFELVTLP